MQEKTNFSTTLKEIILKEDIQLNISQISSQLEIDRSFLTKIIHGSRKFTERKAVENFARIILLSQAETRQLLESYEMDFVGNDVYRRRRLVKEIIEELSKNEFNSIPQVGFQGTKRICLPEQENYMITGAVQVQLWTRQLVELEMQSETKHIMLYMQPYDAGIMQTICNSCVNQPEVTINHILCMEKHIYKSNDNCYNLLILKQIMPLFLEVCNYYANVYYETPVFSHVQFPFYMVTGQAVMLYSADFSSGMFLQGKEVCEFYKKSFENSLRHTESFIKNVFTARDWTATYFQYYQNDFQEHCVLEMEPCIGNIVPQEVIRETMDYQYENSEKILEMGLARCRLFYDKEKARVSRSIFTDEGLKRLIENKRTGGTEGIQFYRDFNDKDLYLIIKAIAAKIRNKTYLPVMLKSSEFLLTGNFNLSMWDENAMVLMFRKPNGVYFSIEIMERSILMSMRDFFESLSGESAYVYTQEETENFFYGLLQQFESRIKG